MLIAEGQSPRYIADHLGHESTRTVLDVYGHLYDGLEESGMEAWSSSERKLRRTPGPSEVVELLS